VFGGMYVGYSVVAFARERSYRELADVARAFILCVSVAMAEADLLWSRQSVEEARNLRREFTGDLRDAKSSVESDREKILCELELSGQEHRVNLAIEVLLTSGMSTPTLQAAAETVGLLEQAGYWSLSITSMIWVSWFASSLVELANYKTSPNYETSTWVDRSGGPPFVHWQFWVLVFSCLQALVWLGRFKFQGKDTRGFAAAAMVKFIGSFLVVTEAAISYINARRDRGDRPSSLWDDWSEAEETRRRTQNQSLYRAQHVQAIGLHLVLGPLVLMLCFAGPRRTSKVPVLGRHIVRCLMMRWSCCCSRRAQTQNL